MLIIDWMYSTLRTNTLQNNPFYMKHIQLFEQFMAESKSIKDHMVKAAEYKKQLMDLKKQTKTARDPQAHQARIAAKEEQLRRVADVIRNLRAEGVRKAMSLLKQKTCVNCNVLLISYRMTMRLFLMMMLSTP